jgi:hypothetical protein
MFIVWGWRTKARAIGKGRFLCPFCCKIQTYVRKRATTRFTLYFIPLFQAGTTKEIVQCQKCQQAFRPSVLDPDLVRDQLRSASDVKGKANPKVPVRIQIDYHPVVGQGSQAVDVTSTGGNRESVR